MTYLSEPTTGVNAYDFVAAKIQEAILSGKFRPGARLPHEEELSAEYGVGRSTIREALRKLGGRGWITITRGSTGGAFVNELEAGSVGHDLGDNLAFLIGLDSLSFAELLEARMLHEINAVQLAANRAGPGELQRIRRLAREAERLIDDPGGFDEANVDFHLAISEAAHNRVLLVWMFGIRRVLGDFMSAATSARDRRAHVAIQHLAIAEAIAGRQPEEAASAMRLHLTDFETDYLRLAESAPVVEQTPPT